MTARRVTTTLVLVLLVTVVAPGSATVPVARLSDLDAARPNPRECIALVEGLFPYGATGARDAVLLVHGWTGRPEAWLGEIDKVVSDYNLPSDRSFADELKRLGDVDVWIIDYYEASHRWVDHPSVAGPIGSAIDCLHERYGRPIGYVAHSMGGLALRQVLAGRESKIGPVVTFGTPHLGSDIAVVLLDILDIAPDIAELVGVQLRRSQNPVAVLGGYLGPVLVEYLIDGVRACGESEDPFACELLGLSIPDAVAAAYSEAGLALLAGVRLHDAGGAMSAALAAIVLRAESDVPVVVLLDHDDQGRRARDTLVKRFGFDRRREVLTYADVFEGGPLGVEAETLFDLGLLDRFVAQRGRSVVAAVHRIAGERVPDLTSAGKAAFVPWVEERATREDVLRWRDLLDRLAECLGT